MKVHMCEDLLSSSGGAMMIWQLYLSLYRIRLHPEKQDREKLEPEVTLKEAHPGHSLQGEAHQQEYFLVPGN